MRRIRMKSLRFFEQFGASGRQLQLAWRSNEQHHAQSGLQVADRARKRRLISVNALGRSATIEFLCGGDEITEIRNSII